MAQLASLAQALDYPFQNTGLLRRALTHRSHSSDHNERLEFLGDSVLNFVVADLLHSRFSDMDEGDLSRLRANLVRQSALAHLAGDLSLSRHLRLGEGERKSGGFNRPSILADTLEAIFGAVYLDGGFDAAWHVVSRLYQPLLADLNPHALGKDPKTLLQERLQALRLELPQYNVVDTHGAAHDQRFDVVCQVPELGIEAQASGTSRREAEQGAAAQALVIIEREHPPAAAPGPERRGAASRRHKKGKLPRASAKVSQESE